MPKPLTCAARMAFIAMLALALLGALDPKERLAVVGIAADKVNHAALSYGLTLLLLASFRRAKPLATSALMMVLGAALEVLQSFSLFAGDGHSLSWRAPLRTGRTAPTATASSAPTDGGVTTAPTEPARQP